VTDRRPYTGSVPTPLGPVPGDPDDPYLWDPEWDLDDEEEVRRPGRRLLRLVVVSVVVVALVILMMASVL